MKAYYPEHCVEWINKVFDRVFTIWGRGGLHSGHHISLRQLREALKEYRDYRAWAEMDAPEDWTPDDILPF